MRLPPTSGQHAGDLCRVLCDPFGVQLHIRARGRAFAAAAAVLAALWYSRLRPILGDREAQLSVNHTSRHSSEMQAPSRRETPPHLGGCFYDEQQIVACRSEPADQQPHLHRMLRSFNPLQVGVEWLTSAALLQRAVPHLESGALLHQRVCIG